MSSLLEAERKSMGAFYTDAQIADFLVWWAVRSRYDTVLDPCFGGGVFLRSACKRVKALGGNPAHQIYGVEIDQGVYARISEKLRDEFGINASSLLQADFFEVSPDVLPSIDVVVGNPPFIRYQTFGGAARLRAFATAAAQGVYLSRLASSWAPFLVHAASMLRSGGRLAMVVPAEIEHAAYAAPILEYLARSFRTITFLTFRKRLFPDLSQDTFLLLAEGKDRQFETALWRDFEHAGELAQLVQQSMLPIPGTQPLHHDTLTAGRLDLVRHYIPAAARGLYEKLCRIPQIRRLGDVADVGIGYVTGANDFFHVTDEIIRKYRIPPRFLRRAVRRGRDLVGVRYTESDWDSARARGEGVYLLHVRATDAVPDEVRMYIRAGEKSGVSRAFKCRTRTPWYSVPHVYQPDAILSYMSGSFPRLVSNDAEAVAPNTLHVVRLKSGFALSRLSLATLWQSSLTRLSAELEGHSLGGGMLKLEPTEAERVLFPYLPEGDEAIQALGEEVDRLCRCGREDEATALVDREVLQNRLGLSEADSRLLRAAAESLEARRCSRRTVG